MRHSESTLIKFFVKVKKKDTLQNLYICISEKKMFGDSTKTTKFVNVHIFMDGGKRQEFRCCGWGLLAYLRQVLHIHFQKISQFINVMRFWLQVIIRECWPLTAVSTLLGNTIHLPDSPCLWSSPNQFQISWNALHSLLAES